MANADSVEDWMLQRLIVFRAGSSAIETGANILRVGSERPVGNFAFHVKCRRWDLRALDVFVLRP
jgi:hypothetical protein